MYSQPNNSRTIGSLTEGCAPKSKVSMVLMFRFTKFWEKNIVIIREKWSVGIMINKEWLEPRLA
jgi:hypothetical protein